MEMTLESLELIEELAYTAGIIDGEGCISIDQVSTNQQRKVRHFQVSVVVNNTSEWLTLWLWATYGGNTIKPRQRNPKHKLLYGWRLNSQEAIEFLESILPYLYIKKLQAKLAIKFQENKKPHPNHRIPYPPELLVLQEADFILMASLNKKGMV